MSLHSKLPPSSAARRVVCPGSRRLEQLYAPIEQSVAAAEGDAAHWLAAQLLTGILDFPEHAPNGELITEDMIEGASLYKEIVCDICADTDRLHVEERVEITTIHPECFGTPDCWVYASKVLYIFDYKFGHGIVEVFENWQLIEYAAGIVDAIEAEIVEIVFYIIQPRSFHPDGKVRSWRTSPIKLFPYFDRLRESEALAINDNAPVRVSSACHHCVARHACPALQFSALATIDNVYLNTPFELTPEQIGSELRYLQRASTLLNDRIAALSEQAAHYLKRGKSIPHFALEQTPGALKWCKSSEEIIALGNLLEINLSKPQTTITPRQAIDAGIPEDLINAYTERYRGALKLVPVDVNKARKVFGK